MPHHQSGDEPVPGYRLVSFIGQGSYGAVWNAVGPGQIDVALKFLNLDSKQGLKEFRSLGLVKKLRHVHLVPIHAIWLRDAAGNVLSDAPGNEGESESVRINLLGSKELVIAMGLGDKNLAQRADEVRDRGGIPLGELLRYMEGAAKGIDYLNEPVHPPGHAAIIHCDIKPGNLLLVGREVQVCDYGVARALSVDMRKTLGAGTPAYAPPELINNDPSPQTDQYSLAISYFEVRTGRLPFDEAKALFANLTGNLDLSALPPEERRVIARATHLQPGRRFPSALEMVEELKIATGVTVVRSGVVAMPQERKSPARPPTNPRTPPLVAPIAPKSSESGNDPWAPSHWQPSPPKRPVPKTDPPGDAGTVRFETPRQQKPPPSTHVDTAPPVDGGTLGIPALHWEKPAGTARPQTKVPETDPWHTWEDPNSAPEAEPGVTTLDRPRRGVPVVGIVLGALIAAGIGVGVYLATFTSTPQMAESTQPTDESAAKKDVPPSPPAPNVGPAASTQNGPPDSPKTPPHPPEKTIKDLKDFVVSSPADALPFVDLAREVKAQTQKQEQHDELLKILADKLIVFCAVWDDSPIPKELQSLVVEAGRANILASLREFEKGLPQIDPTHLDKPYSPADAMRVLRCLRVADQFANDVGAERSDPLRIEFARKMVLAEWSKEGRKLEEVRRRLTALREATGAKEFQWLGASNLDRIQLSLIEARVADGSVAKADRYSKVLEIVKDTFDIPAAAQAELAQWLFNGAGELWFNPGTDDDAGWKVTRTVFRMLNQSAVLAPLKQPKVEELPGGVDGKTKVVVSAFRAIVADVWSRKQPDSSGGKLQEASNYYEEVTGKAADGLTPPARALICQRAAVVGLGVFREYDTVNQWGENTPVPKPRLPEKIRQPVENGIRAGELFLSFPPADAADRAEIHVILYRLHGAGFIDAAREVSAKDAAAAPGDYRAVADHLARTLDHALEAESGFRGGNLPLQPEFRLSFLRNLELDRTKDTPTNNRSWLKSAIEKLPGDKNVPKWMMASAEFGITAKAPIAEAFKERELALTSAREALRANKTPSADRELWESQIRRLERYPKRSSE